MAKSPAFQWYPRDILSSARVAEMSLAEEGAYRRLIDYCWLNGSIPADPIRAARVVGKGCSKEIAQAVLPMFIPDPADPTRLIHDRLEEEREKQATLSNKRASAAFARWSGETRGTVPEGNKQANSPKCKCNANALQMECSSSASSIKEKIDKKEKGAGAPALYSLDDFLQAAKDPSVALAEKDARECFDYYAAQGFLRSNGREITSLPPILRRWKGRIGAFEKLPSASGAGRITLDEFKTAYRRVHQGDFEVDFCPEREHHRAVLGCGSLADVQQRYPDDYADIMRRWDAEFSALKKFVKNKLEKENNGQ